MSPYLQLYIFIFLHQTTTVPLRHPPHAKLYIFIFLHQTTTDGDTCRRIYSCISLYSYIKPQRIGVNGCVWLGCISLYSYIKPQHAVNAGSNAVRCISLYSYIKPQPTAATHRNDGVVYLYIPTSNHNNKMLSTVLLLLYIFIFLHQTTTSTWYKVSY